MLEDLRMRPFHQVPETWTMGSTHFNKVPLCHDVKRVTYVYNSFLSGLFSKPPWPSWDFMIHAEPCWDSWDTRMEPFGRLRGRSQPPSPRPRVSLSSPEKLSVMRRCHPCLHRQMRLHWNEKTAISMAPHVKAMAASRLEVYAMVAKAVPKTTQKTNLGAGADAGSAGPNIPKTSQDFVRSHIVKQTAGKADRNWQKQIETPERFCWCVKCCCSAEMSSLPNCPLTK